MTKTEAIAATKRAKRIFIYVTIFETSKRPFRVTRAAILKTLSIITDGVDIHAEWADDEKTTLLMG